MSVINKLKMAEQFKLGDLIRTQYTVQDKSDQEFAVHASEVLGFKVGVTNVQSARNALGIPPNRGRYAEREDSRLELRVQSLERQILTMSEQIAGIQMRMNDVAERASLLLKK